MKVLIVDADEGFRNHLAQRLIRQGLTVHETDNAEEAHSMACQEKIDAVLVGLSSPKQTLLSFLREIRQNCPKSTVILINHSDDVPLSIEAMKHGAFDEVSTPVDLEELLRKLDAALSGCKNGHQGNL
jgi:DNA-binding NtrC family response regulator